jgi:RNA polymerase sigma-70 factor (ECF subfamily)
VLWLEPVPDAMVGATGSDPAAIVASRASIRLALIAALQHLPPRQRAVLLLRDVLMLRAAEVADLLDTSVAAVNSSLQRARAQLDQAGLTEDDIVEPTDPVQRELLDRYARALENKDVATIVKVFTADAVWEMPPFTAWYQGPADIARLIGTHCPGEAGGMRMVATEANGQPGFALYMRGDDGDWHAFQLQVVTLSAAGISHMTVFFDLSLFATFGLPMMLPADDRMVLASVTP